MAVASHVLRWSVIFLSLSLRIDIGLCGVIVEALGRWNKSAGLLWRAMGWMGSVNGMSK
jgi:hypothetical protein